MKRIFKVFMAHVRANLYVVTHFPKYCVLVNSIKPKGSIMFRTMSIEVGSGSMLKGTWKTEKVFYMEDV